MFACLFYALSGFRVRGFLVKFEKKPGQLLLTEGCTSFPPLSIKWDNHDTLSSIFLKLPC